MKRLLLIFPFALSACITPSEKRDMQNDIFNTQTRLLNLERDISDAKKDASTTGSQTMQRVASTRSEIERLSQDMSRVKGDIDALKIGVTTGKMPGVEEASEGSLAATLQKINDRLDAVEAAQDEILDAINKAGGSKKNAKAAIAKNESSEKSGLAALKAAFDKKSYKQVAEEGPKFLQDAPAKDREEARYIVAESLFKLGRHREAAIRYNEFVEGQPDAARLPHVKMRLGDCFRSLGDAATARIFYEDLIKEHPQSSEAARAKERLAELSRKSGAAATKKG